MPAGQKESAPTPSVPHGGRHWRQAYMIPQDMPTMSGGQWAAVPSAARKSTSNNGAQHFHSKLKRSGVRATTILPWSHRQPGELTLSPIAP